MTELRRLTLADTGLDDLLWEKVQPWIERGDGVAVYENVELGHPELGHRQYASFGGPEAQFQGDPPERLPDFGNQINWRYRLKGVYLG